jgi:hypothetical protein
MTKNIDLVLVVFSFVLIAVLSVYKLVQLFRYRNDPLKRRALISTSQVYPEWLQRWMLGESSKHGRKP